MKKVPFIILTFTAFTAGLISCKHGNSLKVTNQIVIDSLRNRIEILADLNQKTNENKKLVAEFYQELFGDKNIGAIDKYIGETYIQHNPTLPDGKEALKNAAHEWFKNATKEKIDIHHLGADGDLVYIHTKANLGGKYYSIVDIFRLENGKIIEHWDVLQEVPQKSANQHPMF